MIIYIVQGFTGDYEDKESWIAKAFFKKEDAEKYIIQFKDDLKPPELSYFDAFLGYTIDKDEWESRRSEIREKYLKIDPLFKLSYAGMEYEIIEIEVQ
jgi:hypothetical protein